MLCRPVAVTVLLVVLAAAAGGAGQSSPDVKTAAQHPGRGIGPAADHFCFSLEGLPDAEHEAAEDLFLRILDSEGLYTVIGGTKPVSSGFVRFSVEVDHGSIEEVDRHRRLLAAFRCADTVFATVHHFTRTYENLKTGRRERPYEGIVVALDSLRRLVRAHASYFQRLGVSEHSHPLEILMAVEYATDGERWRGYGWMYGFPAAAVDFFVKAGLHQQRTGEFVRRRFVSLPTFARQERGVVYAVAENAADTEIDHDFRRSIEATLAEYRRRRERYVGPGKPGVARLLRDWFCEHGACGLPPVPRRAVSDPERSGPDQPAGASGRQRQRSLP